MTYSGRGRTVGFGEESIWGTPVARTNWLPAESADIYKTVDKQMRTHTGYHGDLGVRRQRFISSIRAGGAVNTEFCYDDSSLLLLKHALGGVSTTGSGPYTHTFVIDELPVGLTIEQIFGQDEAGAGTSQVFEGAKVQSYKLSLSAAGVMKSSVTFLCQDGATRSAAGTPSYSVDAVVALHSHLGTLGWNSNTLSLISFELEVNNGLAERQHTGSALIQEPIRENFPTVKLTCSAEYTSDQLETDLHDDDEGDFSISLTGSGNNAMSITGHNSYLSEVTQSVSGPGIIGVNFTLIPSADASDLGLAIAVTNDNSAATDN